MPGQLYKGTLTKGTPDMLKCGHCGGEDHKLHALPNGTLRTTCCTCRTKSIIMVQPAEMQIEWYNDKQKGCITGGW